MHDEGERIGTPGTRPGWRAYVPFAGLALWLLQRDESERV